ncbi:MAG: SMI1/KNR4 family protein, partial [Lachnospiraceae bacterium]|nr:SMI1/KNR4 family protein [Lachnospiraceae bacterium]
MKTDLEKGLAVFERLLEGENPTAAVGCLYSIPKEYNNNYYKRVLNLLYEEHNTDKRSILFFLSDCSCKKASDIVAFATDEQTEEYLRKDAIYVMGQCDDVLEYTKQFILWMKGDSRLIARTALQVMIRTKAASDDLIEAYKWMWTKYEKDAEMRTSLQHAPSRLLSNWK